MNKQQLGQFYTLKYSYILQGLYIPEYIKNDTNIRFIEPFAGEGHLFDYLKSQDIMFSNILAYDIDPKHPDIVERNTLLDPPNYDNMFIVTNPPYLAKNKSGLNTKTVYELYQTDDLYKAFLLSFIHSKICGGVLILPLSFFCSVRQSDIYLREQFLTKFDIMKLNIFEEPIFKDTNYTICSFLFLPKKSINFDPITTVFYPYQEKTSIHLTPEHNWLYGGDIYQLLNIESDYKINRASLQTPDFIYTTPLILRAVDTMSSTGKLGKRIKLFLDFEGKYIKNIKHTDRIFCVITCNKHLSNDLLHTIVDKFNKYLEEKRTKYHSMFLGSFRSSGRKRISFQLVYKIIEAILIDLI